MQEKPKIIWAGLLGCLLLGISGPGRAEWVDWVLDPGVEIRHEDNINLSAFDADEKSDTAAKITLEAGRYLQMGERTRLRLTASVETEHYDKFGRLNNVAISGSAVVTHKFGLGPRAFWLSPFLTLGHRDVKSDIRTGKFGRCRALSRQTPFRPL